MTIGCALDGTGGTFKGMIRRMSILSGYVGDPINGLELIYTNDANCPACAPKVCPLAGISCINLDMCTDGAIQSWEECDPGVNSVVGCTDCVVDAGF